MGKFLKFLIKPLCNNGGWVEAAITAGAAILPWVVDTVSGWFGSGSSGGGSGFRSGGGIRYPLGFHGIDWDDDDDDYYDPPPRRGRREEEEDVREPTPSVSTQALLDRMDEYKEDQEERIEEHQDRIEAERKRVQAMLDRYETERQEVRSQGLAGIASDRAYWDRMRDQTYSDWMSDRETMLDYWETTRDEQSGFLKDLQQKQLGLARELRDAPSSVAEQARLQADENLRQSVALAGAMGGGVSTNLKALQNRARTVQGDMLTRTSALRAQEYADRINQRSNIMGRAGALSGALIGMGLTDAQLRSARATQNYNILTGLGTANINVGTTLQNRRQSLLSDMLAGMNFGRAISSDYLGAHAGALGLHQNLGTQQLGQTLGIARQDLGWAQHGLQHDLGWASQNLAERTQDFNQWLGQQQAQIARQQAQQQQQIFQQQQSDNTWRRITGVGGTIASILGGEKVGQALEGFGLFGGGSSGGGTSGGSGLFSGGSSYGGGTGSGPLIQGPLAPMRPVNFGNPSQWGSTPTVWDSPSIWN